LPKGSGVEHLRDSNITDTGTVVSVNSNTAITGSFTVVTGSAVELQVTNTGVNIGSALTDSHIISGSLRVNPNGLFVSGSGVIGIGTTSPQSIFHIGASAPAFAGVKPYTGLSSTHEGFLFDYYYNTSSSNLRVFDIAALGFAINGAGGSDIRFLTVPQTTTNTPIERLRITSGGNVGIGTTGGINIVSGWTNLTVNGSTTGIIGIKANEVDYGAMYSSIANNAFVIQAYGSSNNGVMVFLTASTERIRITSTGNVGIGTTSPSGPLHVYSSVTGGLGGHIILDNNGTAIGNETALLFSDGGITNTRAAISSTVEDAPYFGDIKFKTGGGTYASLTPRMIIKGGGNIGMGTVNPVDALVVSGENKTLTFEPAGDASFCGIRWSKNVAGGNVTAASILGTTEGNFGRRGIGFSTGNFADFTTNAVERMRITSVGYLQISNDGNYIASGSPYHQIKNTEATLTLYLLNHNAAGDGLLVNLNTNGTDYNYFRGYSNSAGGNRIIIYSNGNIVNVNNSFGALSDIKLKENIEDATPKLDDLMKVKIRNYNLIGDDRKQIGVIAQELEEIFPAMIDESPDRDKDGNNLGTTTKSVKYSVFVPMLIKAIQEQQTQIESLKAEIQTLKQ
jgi:hypothetical protein